MAAPARFMFDLDFAAPPPKPAEAAVELVPETPKVDLDEHLAEVAAASARARQEGYDEGRRAAEVRAAERLADEAAMLVAASRSLLAALEADRLAI
jgi:flagellar assembly protein FliH